MIYRAIKNFRIAKLVVSVGEVYSGGDIDHLLSKSLIKREEPQEPVTMEVSEVLDEVPPQAEKKSKKKKKAASKPARPKASTAMTASVRLPSAVATQGARTALNPAAAWPFPTGSRP